MYSALARRFLVFDDWHASLLGPTNPNRLYLLSAQSGGTINNTLPDLSVGFQWDTIVDRLRGAGVSVADYYSDLPPTGLFGPRMFPLFRPITRYFEDAEAGEG